MFFLNCKQFFLILFWEDEGKILRIPLNENGSRVEIKVTLTAAKTNLGGDTPSSAFEATPAVNTTTNTVLEPTQEEKDNVSKLIASLGL